MSIHADKLIQCTAVHSIQQHGKGRRYVCQGGLSGVSSFFKLKNGVVRKSCLIHVYVFRKRPHSHVPGGHTQCWVEILSCVRPWEQPLWLLVYESKSTICDKCEDRGDCWGWGFTTEILPNENGGPGVRLIHPGTLIYRPTGETSSVTPEYWDDTLENVKIPHREDKCDNP